MSTVIELTVADNEHEDIAIVLHAHQSYSGLGVLGIWARRSRHSVAVRSVPGGNKTNRTIPRSVINIMTANNSSSHLFRPLPMRVLNAQDSVGQKGGELLV